MSTASDGSRHLVHYADGDAIFTQGDEGEEMYIVQDGLVEIVLEEDGDLVSLATLDRGDFFGEMAVLDGSPRTATARSKGGCSLLPLRGTLFTEMLQRNPETALRIMRKLSSRIRELQRRLAEIPDAQFAVVEEAVPEPAQPAPEPEQLDARLVHDSGAVLDLPDIAEARVGRPDSAVGRVPEVDLTPLNQERTVSRSHARILRRTGRLFVVEETGTTNGTFVNDERLDSGVPHEVHAGDRLTFGTVTLELQIG